MRRVFIAALAVMPLFAPCNVSAQVSSAEFTACLDQDDGTKERLNCFDKLVRPEVQQVLVHQAPRNVYDCRYIKEEDQRLACFNRFVATPARSAPAKRPPKTP